MKKDIHTNNKVNINKNKNSKALRHYKAKSIDISERD